MDGHDTLYGLIGFTCLKRSYPHPQLIYKDVWFNSKSWLNISNTERERLGDEADVHAAVASRLRREELEESGKFRRELAEQARERDFTRSAAVAVGREGKKGRTTDPSVEFV